MLALLLSACFLSATQPMTGEEYIDYFVEARCAECGERYASEEECIGVWTEHYEISFADVGDVCPDVDDLDDCLEAVDEASCDDFANGVGGLDCDPTVLLSEDNCEDDEG